MWYQSKKNPWPAASYIAVIMRYAWANKGLLFATIFMGAIGFGATFIFPALVGSLIDNVIQPRPVNGIMPTSSERLHHLWVLTGIGVITALLFGIAGYGRGHFNMKLGYKIALMIRGDLFAHLQRLSLQFYSRQRTGGIVWRLMQEVHGVNGLINSGVILFSWIFRRSSVAPLPALQNLVAPDCSHPVCAPLVRTDVQDAQSAGAAGERADEPSLRKDHGR